MLQYVWPKLLVWSMWQNDIVLFFDPDVSASIRLPCGSRAFSFYAGIDRALSDARG